MTETQYFTATSIDGLHRRRGQLARVAIRGRVWRGEERSLRTLLQRCRSDGAGRNEPTAGSSATRGFSNIRSDGARTATIPCWVFTTSTLRRFPTLTSRSCAARFSVPERVIVAANDKNIWVVGGGDLAGQFADVGLFDKIMLGVAPVVLFGDGAALFPRRFLTGSLRLGRVRSRWPLRVSRLPRSQRKSSVAADVWSDQRMSRDRQRSASTLPTGLDRW